MVINVTQLNNYIQGLLDVDGVLNDISVCGEITNVKRAKEGWYFSLKDENAAIDCFCYGASNPEPVAGTMIVADGRVNFWTKSGRLSYFVRRFATQNLGASYLRFLELKERLQKEGVFDESRKRKVPQCCLKIGVVTSATGAVIHDIENVAHRRQPFSNIVLFPVKVQGVGADVEIAQGVRFFSASDVDVVIVGRGGGSNEDLSAFNSEIVVRAVADCQKPVVSAVGHGVDFTLCDFAADKRAVTPSEAAEFVTLDSALVKTAILGRLNRVATLISKRLENSKNATVYSVKRISSQIGNEIKANKTAVKFFLSIDVNKLQNRITLLQTKTENAANRLSAANPINVLKRGFAIVEKDGSKVLSAKQVASGDNLKIFVADGQIDAVVK